MTNGCVLDNISRPHRQRSNAARKLKCFWRHCRINTNRTGIQKEVTWTFDGTEGQQALSNALIESIVYRVLSADILTGETCKGGMGFLSMWILSGEEPKCSRRTVLGLSPRQKPYW